MAYDEKPKYRISQIPDGKTETEVRARLNLFDEHCKIGYGRGLRKDFEVCWISERGSVQIVPERDNASRDYIFQLQDDADSKVKMSWLRVPKEVRLSIKGIDFHLFFNRS